MPVIKNPVMEKYKTYYEEKVTGKNGVTKPITKVTYVKPCPMCGSNMFVEKYTPGAVHKAFFCRWRCPHKMCGHSEREPTTFEETVNRLIDETSCNNCGGIGCFDCEPDNF